MKTKLFFLQLNVFVSVLIFSVSAQPSVNNTTSVFGTYRWINEIVIQPCSINGIPTSDSATTSKSGQLFSVIKILPGGYVIKIINYDTTKPLNEINISKFNQYNFSFVEARTRKEGYFPETSQRYFLISTELLLAAASKIEKEKPSLVAGVITLPFKFRLQDGDFTGNFNIGAAGGWRFGHYVSKPAFSILGAASVSTINLDTASVSRNKTEILGTNSLSALTLSFGGMMELGKVQVGAFIGFDWLSRLNNQKFGWRYQGKPWFSFGIGYSIFGAEKKDADEKVKN